MAMTIETQFSLFLVNKPGVLAQICEALAKAKLNIKALTLVDSQEHGVLRLLVEKKIPARELLKKLNIPLTETDVLVVEMSNKPGAMADICNRLAGVHININYAYCTAGAPGGRSVGVFKVADIKKAIKALQKRKAPKKQVSLGKRPRGRH